MFDSQQPPLGGMGGFSPFMNGGSTSPTPNAWAAPDQMNGGFPGSAPGAQGVPMMPGGIPMLPTDPAMLQQLHPGMVPVPAPGMPPGMFMMVPQHMAMQQFQSPMPPQPFQSRNSGQQNAWSM